MAGTIRTKLYFISYHMVLVLPVDCGRNLDDMSTTTAHDGAHKYKNLFLFRQFSHSNWGLSSIFVANRGYYCFFENDSSYTTFSDFELSNKLVLEF